MGFCEEQVCNVCGKHLALRDDKCWECLEDEERFEMTKLLTDGFFEYRLEIVEDCPLDFDEAVKRVNEVMEDAWADVEAEIIGIEDLAYPEVETEILRLLEKGEDAHGLDWVLGNYTPSVALMIWPDSYRLDDVYNYVLDDIVAAAQLEPPNCMYWGLTRIQNCLGRVPREEVIAFLEDLVRKQEEE